MAQRQRVASTKLAEILIAEASVRYLDGLTLAFRLLI